MKRLITGVLLGLLICCTTIIPACQSSGYIWSDIPAYPGATQISVRTWLVLPSEGVDWSGVEWKYYSSNDSSQVVDDFYKTELPKKGWQNMAGQEPDNILQIETSYYSKIGIYADVNTLEDWSAFSKNEGRDWILFWAGLKDTEPVPGQTYVTIGGQSHDTFFVILRSKS
jgi:hypothetical protein